MSNEQQLATSPDGKSAAARPAPIDGARWRARLAELIAKHKVPAAALGILSGGEIVDVAAGLLSKKTLVGATPDSVFQIGSITKVWTTTLIMQLVDEGKLTLDTPVAQIIPDFAVSDPQVSKQVTIRHLLTHTSGIDGDVFTDTGRGDDCLEKYVADMDTVAQNHPLGATFSYCNSGFSLAGRIIEVLTGKTWDAVLRERIIEPLGLTATVTLPEEAILHRAAVGHLGNPGEDPQPARLWQLPRSAGPAGTITARVHDLLEFAKMHLAGGLAPDDSRILSQKAADAMTQHEVDLPDPDVLGDSWGLGWIRFSWDGHRLFGHDGSTVGQGAFMRILPGAGICGGVADQWWRRPRALPGPVRGDLRRPGGREHAGAVRAAGEPAVDRPATVRGHVFAGRRRRGVRDARRSVGADHDTERGNGQYRAGKP